MSIDVKYMDQAWRAYKVAFARDPLEGDQEGLIYWGQRMADGIDLPELALHFTYSQEFADLYGHRPSNEQFLSRLYHNVLGRDPDPDGYRWWLTEMATNPEKTQAKVMADFVQSPEFNDKTPDTIMNKLTTLASTLVPIVCVGCGGGGGDVSAPITTVSSTSNNAPITQLPVQEPDTSTPTIRELKQDYIANIDLRFDHETDFTNDGLLVNGFDNVRRHVDLAKKHGFTAIEIDASVPIDSNTGSLLMMTAPGEPNRDKSLPDDIWKIIDYAESLGLDTSIKLNVVDASTDNFIMTNTVGPRFDTTKFFDSVKSYQTHIAGLAQKHGVDQIVIGSNNHGLDQAHDQEWKELVDSIRSVYKGELAYETFYHRDGVIPWKYVDNIAAQFQPDLGSKQYHVGNIVPLYLTTDANGFNPYQEIKDFATSHPDKDVMLYGIGKSPLQTALNEDVQVHTVYDGKILDLSGMDTLLQEARYRAFMEFAGNHLQDEIDAIQFWQFAPWMDAGWIEEPPPAPGDFWGKAYQAYAKGGYALNYQPQVLDVLDDYMIPGWGTNFFDF